MNAIPEHFYKYTSASTAQTILTNGSLRWSRPALLNDPYDIQFDLHVEVDKVKLRELTLRKLRDILSGTSTYVPAEDNIMGALLPVARAVLSQLPPEEFDRFGDSAIEGLEALEKNLPEHQALLRGFAATSKVLCLSEVGDSLLMWAYYAQQHRGAVIRFRPNSPDSIFGVARPVNYSQKMPRLFDEDYMSDMLMGTANTTPEEIAAKTIFTKAIEWAHEYEWRLFAGSGWKPSDEFEDVEFDERDLDAVILGCAMSHETGQEMRDLVRSRYPHAEVLKAAKHDREFKLVFNRLG